MWGERGTEASAGSEAAAGRANDKWCRQPSRNTPSATWPNPYLPADAEIGPADTPTGRTLSGPLGKKKEPCHGRWRAYLSRASASARRARFVHQHRRTRYERDHVFIMEVLTAPPRTHAPEEAANNCEKWRCPNVLTCVLPNRSIPFPQVTEYPLVTPECGWLR